MLTSHGECEPSTSDLNSLMIPFLPPSLALGPRVFMAAPVPLGFFGREHSKAKIMLKSCSDLKLVPEHLSDRRGKGRVSRRSCQQRF